MKIAQSYQYRGIPIAININRLSRTSIISTNTFAKKYTCTDIELLKRVAETLIDQEIDGVLHNTSYKLRNYVSF